GGTVSEPLGHEPEETRDREFAPVLREDEEALSREQARTQERKVTGTGVVTPIPAGDQETDKSEGTGHDAAEARSRFEDPTAGEAGRDSGQDAGGGARADDEGGRTG